MKQASNKILLNPDSRLTCPACKHEFALAEGFARHALEQAEDASVEAMTRLRDEERLIAQRHAELMAKERDAAHGRALAEVRALTAQSFAEELRSYEKRLSEQTTKLQVLQTEQLGLREERQKLQDEKAVIALDVQRRVDTQIQQRESVIRTQEQERAHLERAELQKKLDDAGAQLAVAQRKMEQGSQQLQGEVLELAIEEMLRRTFPLDLIEEVKKGQRGGDVLHRVVTRSGQTAGTILWETKRAKEWGSQWIEKLKEDMRACGAAVGILVTVPGCFPRDWPAGAYFTLHEDIWVTQPSTAPGIAEALRLGLIDLHRQRAVSAGKGEKMEALYDYLTSPQFAHKLKAVYETFKKMREELESEKSITTQRWARREKQLQAGVNQLLGIGGEIQGLSHQELPMLELEPEVRGDQR